MLGGKLHKAHLVQMVMTPELADKYNVHPQRIVNYLESVIGAYEAALPNLRRKLYNPFYWLGLFVRSVIRIPFAFLDGLGLDVQPVEVSRVGKLIKIVWTVLVLGGVTFLGAYSDLRSLGWWDDIQRILPGL